MFQNTFVFMQTNPSYYLNNSYGEFFIQAFAELGTDLDYLPNVLIESDLECKNYCYLILEGTVKQYFTDQDGKQYTVLLLSRGDIFGEINMLQNNIDLVLSESLTACKVKRIQKAEFDQALRAHPDLMMAFIQMQTSKSRMFLFQIQDLSYLDVKNRLKNLLIRLGILYGVSQDEQIKINLLISHEELAKMIGSTRSTVTKMLSELSDSGFLEMKQKFIYLNNRK
ncbi:MAG: Crp/Fnr family transcriptional regulator [Eubacteriales bacterium]|nr:Crp/Fnr family transcriptional regulator [Eubacteriales bacterium]